MNAKTGSGTQKRTLYSKLTDAVVEKHILLDHLIKSDFENADSNSSKTCHITAYKRLFHVLENRSNKRSSLFLSQEERAKLQVSCIITKSMMDWKFSYRKFYKRICLTADLPLELLWKLHACGIMSFETYLTGILYKPKMLTSFCRSAISLCANYRKGELPAFICKDVLRFFVTQAYGNSIESSPPSVSKLQKVCNLFFECLIKRIIISSKNSKSKKLPIFVLWNERTVDTSLLHSFCVAALNFILKRTPTEAYQAISEQSKWNSGPKKFTRLSFFIRKIFMVLDPVLVSDILLQTVLSEQVNWNYMLIIFSNFLTTYKFGFTYILSTMDYLLKKAFEDCSVYFLYSSFLLARQGAFIGCPHFPFTYSTWFKNSFIDGPTTYIKDQKSFAFLISFLADLVPTEAEHYLKVHIANQCSMMAYNRYVFSDFVALVKTRLTDLQKPPDTIMEKILKNFENTGKVPTTVLEASMLHKHHYLNDFLPRLLSPRVLPSIPDTKMKFIKALKIAGKIPKDIYEKYEKGCVTAVINDTWVFDVKCAWLENNAL